MSRVHPDRRPRCSACGHVHAGQQLGGICLDCLDCSQDEQWRPVSGYEGRYEVSDLGRVRSLPRLSPRTGRYRVRVDGDQWFWIAA